MAKVIVFHYTDEGRLPPLSTVELTDLKTEFDSEPKKHPDVTFNRTFIDDSGRGICDWDAPSAAAVSYIIEAVIGAPPADGAVVVKSGSVRGPACGQMGETGARANFDMRFYEKVIRIDRNISKETLDISAHQSDRIRTKRPA
ncbi:MAG: hypothetical protein EF813_02950 [Methanosarcinales archaeon]|nr:MAG: hypothetical protein EF813_02950 [Methanosarcinales archaeon]